MRCVFFYMMLFKITQEHQTNSVMSCLYMISKFRLEDGDLIVCTWSPWWFVHDITLVHKLTISKTRHLVFCFVLRSICQLVSTNTHRTIQSRWLLLIHIVGSYVRGWLLTHILYWTYTIENLDIKLTNWLFGLSQHVLYV